MKPDHRKYEAAPTLRKNNWSTKPDISRAPHSNFWVQRFEKQVSGNKLPMLNNKSLIWKIGDIWWPILPACLTAKEQLSKQPYKFHHSVSVSILVSAKQGTQDTQVHQGHLPCTTPTLQRPRKDHPLLWPTQSTMQCHSRSKATQCGAFINNAHLFTSWLSLRRHWKKF